MATTPLEYYYGTRVVSDWAQGSPIRYDYPDGTPAADGEVLAVDPPKRLEMTFRALWDPELEAEGHVRQLWQLEPAGEAGTPTKLTVTTFGMSPKLASEFAGGMVWIVSGLKSHVEGAGCGRLRRLTRPFSRSAAPAGIPRGPFRRC